MTKHKTDDYKNSAVKYYLNNENGDGYNKTCKIFGCKKGFALKGADLNLQGCKCI